MKGPMTQSSNKIRLLAGAVLATATFMYVTSPAVAGQSPGPAAPVEANIYSTLPSTDAHRPEMALDGDQATYFESVRGMGDGDDFLVLLTRPIPVISITVTSGNSQGQELLTQGMLETSPDGQTYTSAASFGPNGIAKASIKGKPVEAIRIRVPQNGNVPNLAIREIFIDSPVSISYAQWAPGRGFIDVSRAPDVKDWAVRAEKEMAEFWPNTDAILYSDGFIPPNMVNMVFADGDGVAATGGGVMTVNARWCRAHPDDTGLTVHETSHAIQAYPDYSAGWLVEGIADYIRWVKFEPQHFHPRIDPQKSTYHDAYQTTAAFLAWCSIHYDSGLVTKLNGTLRNGTYSDGLFKQYCGKDVNDLWAEFVQDYQTNPTGILTASNQ